MKKTKYSALISIFLIILLFGCQNGDSEKEMKLSTDIERGTKGYIGLSVYGKNGEIIIGGNFVSSDYKKDISVADLLKDIGRELKIPVVVKVSFMGTYIEGINNLFEFEHGAQSGWIYFVNGESQGIGCDSYILQDGDYVEWRYTLDLGKDIGAYNLTE